MSKIMMKICQGDQYLIPITVKRNGVVQTSSEIDRMEVIIGSIRKEYPENMEYHSSSQKFLFPLNEEESLTLPANVYDVMCRPLYSDGTIIGWKSAGSLQVVEMKGAEQIEH